MLYIKAHSAGAGRLKIAVVGSGIAGLGAAYSLCHAHDVTLFEARGRLGGHSRTLMAGHGEKFPVDTGFMVFNYRNYPNLNALFEQLDIPVIPSNMSFAVSLDGGKFEYGLHQLSRLFADKRNIFNPKLWRMLLDILKFNKHAPAYEDNTEMSIGEVIAKLGLSDMFRDRYLCPLAGAIWSTTNDEILKFPAQTLIRFFKNHGLLSATDHPKWYTVKGGSRVYVERMGAALEEMGCDIRLGTPVKSVTRKGGKVTVKANGKAETFDAIIFACHSNQALDILDKPSKDEQDILGAIRFKDNTVILHDDPAHMPKRKACWSSWVYKGSSSDQSASSFTYWMNLLQSIPEETPVFVTLNPKTPVREEHIFNTATLAHPQFDLPAINAQKKLPGIQGANNTWYCGAYTRYGFHEDGLASGLEAARSLHAAQAALS